VDAAIKFRPTEAEVEDIGPEFRERWNEFYADKADKPLFWLGALAGCVQGLIFSYCQWNYVCVSLPTDQTGFPVANFMSAGCFLVSSRSQQSC